MMMLLYWSIDVFGGATIVTTQSQEMRSRNGLSNSAFFLIFLSVVVAVFIVFFFLFCVARYFFTIPFTISFHAHAQICDGVFHEIFVCSLPLCLKHTARQFLIVS